MSLKIKMKKIYRDSIIPKYQSSGASGFDLHSIENITIKAGEFMPIKSGLAFEIPQGYELQVRPRSGLAYKNGISVLNTPGTVDSDYRGEVIVILFNFSKNDFEIKIGDRIAQAVICPIVQVDFELSENLSDTHRGQKGFGSTGV